MSDIHVCSDFNYCLYIISHIWDQGAIENFRAEPHFKPFSCGLSDSPPTAGDSYAYKCWAHSGSQEVSFSNKWWKKWWTFISNDMLPRLFQRRDHQHSYYTMYIGLWCPWTKGMFIWGWIIFGSIDHLCLVAMWRCRYKERTSLKSHSQERQTYIYYY